MGTVFNSWVQHYFSLHLFLYLRRSITYLTISFEFWWAGLICRVSNSGVLFMHSCNYTLCVSVLVLPGGKKSLIQMHYYCIETQANWWSNRGSSASHKEKGEREVVLDPTVKDRKDWAPSSTSWSMQDYTNPQSCFQTFCYFNAHACSSNPTLPHFFKNVFCTCIIMHARASTHTSIWVIIIVDMYKESLLPFLSLTDYPLQQLVGNRNYHKTTLIYFVAYSPTQ